ncbi:MAG: hypothetical protein ACFFKA_05945, partial [Candidatus Thorarchaeota archaeon]
MGNGKGLAVLAIILGVIGIGMGGYAIISQIFTPKVEIKESNYWYAQQGYQDLWGEWSSFENLSLIISVVTGEKVFVSYTGKLTIFNAYAKFQIAVNDIQEPASEAYLYTGTSFTIIQVSLQYILDDLVTG